MRIINFLFAIVLYFSFTDIKAIVTYQAEDAQLQYHVSIDSEHGGTGSGYVNFDNEVGSYIELLINMATTDTQTLTIYYAYLANPVRNMDLIVNGVNVATVPFPATGDWKIWSTYDVKVKLTEGNNIVRFTSATTDGGPNIDKIDVTGEAGSIASYILNLNTLGDGSISGANNGEYFQEGSEITLKAIPSDNESFGGWKGNVNSTDETITFKITENVTLNAIFIPKGYYKKLDEKIGWCDYNYATTGGESGTEVTVTTLSELKSYINKTGKYIIKVKGEIHLDSYEKMNVGSDKTIIGDTTGAIISGGGFRIYNASNVIIKYIVFKDAYVTWDGETTDNDAIEVNNSTHVWIDHCEFSHYDDGLCDIKNASDYVTVSWCHFYNHNKVMLIGADDDATQDIDHLNVTVHHCWFDGNGGNGIGQRLPMGRYGKIHAFNNYYNDAITRCVEANYNANISVENNYFLNSEMPHAIVGGAGDNKITATGNIYVNSGTRRDNSGDAFNPSDYYEYTLDNAEIVPTIVMLGAGVVYFSEIGKKETSSVENIISENNFILEQNYPNPFSERTVIKFYLPEQTKVTLNIIDINGSMVKTLINEEVKKGNNEVILNKNDLIPGIYFYQLKCFDTIITKSLVIFQ